MKRFAALLLALLPACGSCGACGTRAAPDAGVAAAPDPTLRLPAGVTPVEYALELRVFPEKERFEGRVTIKVALEQAQSRIWLHARSIALRKGLARDVPAKLTQVNDDGLARLDLDRPVGPGEVTLDLEYDAPFDAHLNGLYRVQDRGDWYAFTQLEAVAARLMMPCFDEPGFKTPFEVTLVVAPEHMAISNGPVASDERLDDGTRRFRFAKTPKLPVYLLAVAVGPLDVVDFEAIAPNAMRKEPLPLRGVTARGKGAQIRGTLQRTAQIVNALEAYTGIAHPYPKLDIVAVPDFEPGAMENAGAVFFEESLVLFDEDASERQLRDLSSTLAHELAHQWFGNLVTMQWWDDLWLNEATATWLATKIAREVTPDDHPEVDRALATLQAMRDDRLASARVIRAPIVEHGDIENAFDNITYWKGAAVLGMFERYLGVPAFQKGMRLHLTRHAGGNASADQFIEAFSEGAGLDVGKALRTFLAQPGVPLIAVKSECETGNRAAVLARQSRDLPLGSQGEKKASWQIPVCLRYALPDGEEERCQIMDVEQTRWVLSGSQCVKWLLPNSDGAGYYRYGLEKGAIDKLESGDAWKALTVPEKVTLAGSIEGGFFAGDLAAGDALAALEPFARAPDAQLSTLPYPIQRFVGDQVLPGDPAMQAYVQKLYAAAKPGLKKILAGGKAHPESAELLEHLVVFARDPELTRAAAERGRQLIGYRKDGKLHEDAVDKDLAKVALIAALGEDGAPFFGAMRAMFQTTDDAWLRVELLQAMAQARTATLAAQARALALDPGVKQNELKPLLHAAQERAEHREAFWSWFTANFEALAGRLPTVQLTFLPELAQPYCTDTRAAEVKAFFEPRLARLPGAAHNLSLALESITLCAAQAKHHHDAAASWLAARKQGK